MSNEDVFGQEYYRDQLYTPTQSRILINIPRASGTLSVLGSSIIVFIILKDRKKKLRRLYHRILFSHSLLDIMCSFNWALSSLIVPKGTPGVWNAQGTMATCEASGFVTQFSFSLTLYSTFLAVYYSLILAFRIRERTMARWMEPVVHLLAYGMPLILGSVMVAKDYYNPANIIVGWCFINVYPMDCLRRDGVVCERGEKYAAWMMFFYVATFGAFLVVLICSILTYWTVRQQFRRSARWVAFDSSPRDKEKETAIQAFLYVSSFAFTYVGLGVAAFFGPTPATAETQHFFFPVVVLVKIFYPLQGFWNCFIFIRPRYKVIRSRSPGLSYWEIWSEIIKEEASPGFQRRGSRDDIVLNKKPGFWRRPSLMSGEVGASNYFDEFMPESKNVHSVSSFIFHAKRRRSMEIKPGSDNCKDGVSNLGDDKSFELGLSPVGPCEDMGKIDEDIEALDDMGKIDEDIKAVHETEKGENDPKSDAARQRSTAVVQQIDTVLPIESSSEVLVMADLSEDEEGDEPDEALPVMKEIPVMPDFTSSAELTIDA